MLLYICIVEQGESKTQNSYSVHHSTTTKVDELYFPSNMEVCHDLCLSFTWPPTTLSTITTRIHVKFDPRWPLNTLPQAQLDSSSVLSFPSQKMFSALNDPTVSRPSLSSFYLGPSTSCRNEGRCGLLSPSPMYCCSWRPQCSQRPWTSILSPHPTQRRSWEAAIR